MILGDVEETVTTSEIDEETYEEIFKVGTSWYLTFCMIVWDALNVYADIWSSIIEGACYFDERIEEGEVINAWKQTCVCIMSTKEILSI